MLVIIAFISNTLFNFVVGLLVAKFLGPAEFGRFALAIAITLVVQTTIFDWIRLSATRFYSERTRAEEPGLRATLDLAFAILAALLTLVGGFIAFAHFNLALSGGVIGLALAASIANGLFDYHSALVRARFNDHLYVRLIIIKNILALLLTGGGAFVFESAAMTLLGGILSLVGSLGASRASLVEDAAPASEASRARMAELAKYALPIVAANILYLMIPLINRSLVTSFYGFAETGQFSLAYDIGLKAAQAIGSTADVLLFQLAVRAHEAHGPEKAQEQVARNMAIVFAILLPASVGIWLTLPSIEMLIVPGEYRGPFRHYLGLMLPGLCCLSLIQFAINPIFQIAKRTGPVIGAAVIACVAAPLFMLVLPHSADASSLAIAQAGAFGVALIALILFASSSNPVWPKLRDLLGIVAGTGAMFAAVWPLYDMKPGVATLVLQIALGGAVYGAFTLALNLAGLRTMITDRLAARRAA